jgi:hypothetical protein
MADAIRVGSKKLMEGCSSCAEAYFSLARQHGASEQAIQAAKTALAKSTPATDAKKHLLRPQSLQITRREVLKVAAAGAVGAAASAGPLDLLVRPDDAAAALVFDGAAVAWILCTRSVPGAEHQLIGIAPDGHLVRALNTVSPRTMRTLDGLRLCSLESIRQGPEVRLMVSIYTAASGSLEGTIRGRAIAVTAVGDFDAVTSSVAPDNRYLAVLHQTIRGFVPPPPIPVPPAVAGPVLNPTEIFVANSIEIFDLEDKLSIAYFDMGESAENRLGSQVEWSPSGGRVYAITSDDHFTESMTVFAFDGVHLTLHSHATDGVDGHSIPRSDLPVPSMLKILDGGRTLVRYVAAGEVHWLDLDGLTLTHRIPLPSGANLSGAKGLAAASAFSADGATLYLANPLTGFVGAVDVQAGSVSKAAFLPSQGPNQSPPQIGDFGLDTVAQSADGSRLYVLDGRMATRLIWTLSVPDLEIMTQGTYGDVSGLWPSAGGSLFAFNLGQRTVDIIARDGTLASTIGLHTRPHSFLRKGRGLSW